MMKRNWIVLSIIIPLLVTGCATVNSKKAASTPAPMADTARVGQLETEIEVRDKKIAALENELMKARSGSFQSVAAPITSGVIRVPGVQVTEIQTALKRAGIDPGPIDGKLGSKTKEAIKEFQRRRNLKADGIVGAKTWALLK